jgi:DNA ligase D-like protein (predicted 3'-phosphoesterase)
MTRDNRLADYRSKRDPGVFGEPAGRRRSRGTGSMFVIQRHDASLHFDFRLEVDGVLASWAAPKGPSTDPRDKRLATRTEDHPLDYAEFDGVIPEGNYGAGTVIVWDIGEYHSETERDGQEVPMTYALADGHARIRLDGHKLSGSFALTNTRMRGDERNWLLVKVDDDGADRCPRPTTSQPESAISGRTNDELGRS